MGNREFDNKTKEFLEYIDLLEDEIKKRPCSEGLRIYFLNLLSEYHRNRLPDSPLSFHRFALQKVSNMKDANARFYALVALTNAYVRYAGKKKITAILV